VVEDDPCNDRRSLFKPSSSYLARLPHPARRQPKPSLSSHCKRPLILVPRNYGQRKRSVSIDLLCSSLLRICYSLEADPPTFGDPISLGWTPKLWAAVVGLVAYGIVACFLSFREFQIQFRRDRSQRQRNSRWRSSRSLHPRLVLKSCSSHWQDGGRA
jgi:hypothetical protein